MSEQTIEQLVHLHGNWKYMSTCTEELTFEGMYLLIGEWELSPDFPRLGALVFYCWNRRFLLLRWALFSGLGWQDSPVIYHKATPWEREVLVDGTLDSRCQAFQKKREALVGFFSSAVWRGGERKDRRDFFAKFEQNCININLSRPFNINQAVNVTPHSRVGFLRPAKEMRKRVV